MFPRVVINSIALKLQSSDLQYRSNESRIPMNNRKKLEVRYLDLLNLIFQFISYRRCITMGGVGYVPL